MYFFEYTSDMARHISIKELRPKLPEVMRLVDSRMERYIVTKRGKPVAVIINHDDYEGLLETIDILEDKELMKRLRKAERQVKSGQTTSLEEIDRSLGRARA